VSGRTRWTVGPISEVVSIVQANGYDDSAAAELHAALETWSADPARFAEHLGFLADLHLTAYWATDDPTQLDAAVAVWSRARPDTPGINGLVAARLRLFGNGLDIAVARQRGGDDGMAEALIELCQRIRQELPQLREPTLMNDVAINAAAWARRATQAQRWSAVAAGFDVAARAADQLVRSLPLDQRLSAIRRYRVLALDSASAFVRANRVRDAVVAVEASRQRLLRALGTGGEVELLRARDPVLHERWMALHGEWVDVRGAHFRVAEPGEIDLAIARGHEAEQRLIDLLEQIRQIPGLERFARKLGMSDIVAAASDGPLLYVWSGESATCLVLVLPDGAIKPFAFEPGSEHIDALVRDWLKVIEPTSKVDVLTRMRTLAVVGHLAEEYFAPQMKDLLTSQLNLPKEDTGWKWGPATLIVSGSLSQLPFHAWSPYLADKKTGELVSVMPLKYAPSARQVLVAQQTSRRLPTTMRLLSLADPTREGLPALPCSRIEQDVIGEISEDNQLFRGPGATRVALLNNLPQCDVLHLACHGSISQGVIGSQLELADGPMGFNELWGTGSLSHLSLAVLSACRSGQQDPQAPEETLDVGSLLLELGAPAVVSTLWPVDDLAAALFISQMFRFWWHDGLLVPAAVTATGLWLKELTNRDLLDWAEADPRWMPHVRRYVHGLPEHLKRFDEPYYWAAFAYSGA
jgi:hypothetical protein